MRSSSSQVKIVKDFGGCVSLFMEHNYYDYKKSTYIGRTSYSSFFHDIMFFDTYIQSAIPGRILIDVYVINVSFSVSFAL